MIKVSVRHLGKTYKNGVNALKDINFDVNAGEFVSLIGMSGAGKTSLIRIANGSIKPTMGEILIDGISVCNMKNRQIIGTIYQDFRLVDALTTYDNVLNGCLCERNFMQTLFGIFTNEQKKRVEDALKQVGLIDKKNVKAKELSGGQKQRAAIARAIMQKPQILLADEPVASLDPYTSQQILGIIKSLQKEYNLTVIMNSHNVEASVKYSDRIIGIKDGKSVLDRPADKITKEDLEMIYGDHDEKL